MTHNTQHYVFSDNLRVVHRKRDRLRDDEARHTRNLAKKLRALAYDAQQRSAETRHRKNGDGLC